MNKVIVIVLVVLLLGIGVLFATNNSRKTPETVPAPTSSDSTVPPTQSGNEPTPAETGPDESVAATIVYTDDGFVPSSVTVKSGDKISVQNKSSRSLQFSSAPHPSHTENRELNQNTLPAGGSQTFTVTTKGRFGFHDHLNPSNTGTLVVE